jgi:hypothetical protein
MRRLDLMKVRIWIHGGEGILTIHSTGQSHKIVQLRGFTKPKQFGKSAATLNPDYASQ